MLKAGDVKIIGLGSERQDQKFVRKRSVVIKHDAAARGINARERGAEKTDRTAANDIRYRDAQCGCEIRIFCDTARNRGDFVEAGRVEVVRIAVHEDDSVSVRRDRRIFGQHECGGESAESGARHHNPFFFHKRHRTDDDSIAYLRYDTYMMVIRSVGDMRILPGMRVLLRADFDVVPDGDRIADSARIEAVLPTIRFLLERGASLRLLAHRGRPGGIKREEWSLIPVAAILSRALGRPVRLISDPFRTDASPPEGDDAAIILFENLRFWSGEEQNDSVFARALAAHGEAYVNEAFAACHRSHASIVSLPRLLPSYAGFNLLKEIRALERVATYPERPLVAVFGGAKMETKLPLIRRFLMHADCVIVGGALANTIFALRGEGIGRSVADTGCTEPTAFLHDPKLFLPRDFVIADRLAAGAASAVRAIGEVKDDEYIADIGPESRTAFAGLLAGARTVIWNGPMGYAEAPELAEGTIALARSIQTIKGFTIVGGGDTIAALARYGLQSGFSHVSTGGGAMLEFLSGKDLPGLIALR